MFDKPVNKINRGRLQHICKGNLPLFYGWDTFCHAGILPLKCCIAPVDHDMQLIKQ